MKKTPLITKVLNLGRIRVTVWTSDLEQSRELNFSGVDIDEVDFDFWLSRSSVKRLLSFIKETFPKTYQEWSTKN